MRFPWFSNPRSDAEKALRDTYKRCFALRVEALETQIEAQRFMNADFVERLLDLETVVADLVLKHEEQEAKG